MFSEAEKKVIIDRLNSRHFLSRCPMCGTERFSLADAYISNSLQESYKVIKIGGGPAIPAVAVICNNCGFISQHALGVLGLLIEPSVPTSVEATKNSGSGEKP